MRGNALVWFALGFGAYWAMQHFGGVGVTGRGKAA